MPLLCVLDKYHSAEDIFSQMAGYFNKTCIKNGEAFYIDCHPMLKNGEQLPPCRPGSTTYAVQYYITAETVL